MNEKIKEILAGVIYTTPDRIIPRSDIKITQKIKEYIKNVITIKCDDIEIEIPIVGDDDPIIDLIIKRRFPQMSSNIEKSMLLSILVNILQTELNCDVRIKQIKDDYPVSTLKVAGYLQTNNSNEIILYRVLSEDDVKNYTHNELNEKYNLYKNQTNEQHKTINSIIEYLASQQSPFIIKTGIVSDVSFTGIKILLNNDVTLYITAINSLHIKQLLNYLSFNKHYSFEILSDNDQYSIDKGIYIGGKLKGTDEFQIISIIEVLDELYSEFDFVLKMNFNEVYQNFKEKYSIDRLNTFIKKLLNGNYMSDEVQLKELLDIYSEIINDDNLPDLIRDYLKNKASDIIVILSGNCNMESIENFIEGFKEVIKKVV